MANPNDNKRKVAIILASAFLLVVIGAAITIGIVTSPDEDSTRDAATSVATTSKAAKAICQPTSYKETCLGSLKNANSSDPKELIKAGFRAAKKYIGEAAKKSVTLQALEKEPRASEALKNCKYLMDSALEDLESSLKRFAEFHKGQTELLLSDLKVWLSAAYTNQVTCADGFENTTSTSGKKMKEVLKKPEELISNGLAMVHEISGILNHLNIENFNKRRLLGLNNLDTDETWDPNPSEELFRRRLLAVKPSELNPDLTVAKDGSGKYKTIGEALKDIPEKSKTPFVLYIKEGVYQEQVVFDKHMTNLVVIGDGPTKTKITYNKNFVDGTTTFKSASVAVQGDNFIAKDIGFENSAGPGKHQAVALRVGADKAVFYNCQMDGYQDTLYVHTKRQFYRDCTISGTIDFVFGDSAVVFQNCKFLIRKPLDNQQCIVTAQGRKERREATAIIIQNGTITAHPSLPPAKDKVKSYLGRPWKVHSRTIIMESFIDDLIQPDGWMPWNEKVGLSTIFYSELSNRGPGADTSRRVKWRGVKSITAEHARTRFTPQIFLLGNHWIPATGVPYTPGMLNV